MRPIICELIENMVHQTEIYEAMYALSKDQTAILQRSDFTEQMAEFWDILDRKRQMVASVDQRRTRARELETVMTEGFGIESFRLSFLKDHLAEDEFQSLREAVYGLGAVVSELIKVEEQVEGLLRSNLSRLNQPSRTRRQSSKKAAAAYASQASESKKKPNNGQS